jgi:hypothetical protein
MGGRAVHIPYEVTWRHEHVDEELLPSDGWFRLASISELGALLDSLEPGTGSSDHQRIQSRPDRSKKRESGPLPLE